MQTEKYNSIILKKFLFKKTNRKPHFTHQIGRYKALYNVTDTIAASVFLPLPSGGLATPLKDGEQRGRCVTDKQGWEQARQERCQGTKYKKALILGVAHVQGQP